MKVLFLCKCSPLKEGGAETRSKEVALQSARLGHEVTILCARTSTDEPAEQSLRGVRIITKKVLPDWLLKRFPYPHYFPLGASSLFLMFHLRRLLKREKFDLVREDLSPFAPSGLLALRKLSASSRIAVVHNLSPTLGGWVKFYGPVYGIAGYLMYRALVTGRLKYDRIICVARWLADDFSKHRLITDKVRYVPNGISLKDFQAATLTRVKLNGSEKVRLLGVGRLVELKGFRYAVEAMAHLKDEYPAAHLDILGGGPLKDSLEGLAERLGVSHMISFLPPVSYDQMPEIYRQYHLFVLPSLTEGLPMAMIEAMASGLPVVASDIPAVNMILNDQQQMLARKEDAIDLARKIKWAIKHPEEVGQAAMKASILAREFNWERAVQQELECHRDCVQT